MDIGRIESSPGVRKAECEQKGHQAYPILRATHTSKVSQGVEGTLLAMIETLPFHQTKAPTHCPSRLCAHEAQVPEGTTLDDNTLRLEQQRRWRDRPEPLQLGRPRNDKGNDVGPSSNHLTSIPQRNTAAHQTVQLGHANGSDGTISRPYDAEVPPSFIGGKGRSDKEGDRLVRRLPTCRMP